MVALLFSNVQLSTYPCDPIQIIAPPSPPVVFVPFGSGPLTIPKAVLFVKLEPSILPYSPYQYTAPPDLLAVLLSNVELIILPLVAPSCQSIAPPLTPAVLLIKWELANVVLLQSLAVKLRKNTAPPFLAAVLLMK